MQIGIDIGGTHTDAVLVDKHHHIVKQVKVLTTPSVEEGVFHALSKIGYSKNVSRICIGTTHAINAILQCTDLYRVGVIRLAGNRPTTLPTCIGWPKRLREAIYVDTITIDGGFECNGSPITPFDRQQVEKAAQKLLAMGAESLAIIGVFSTLHHSQEEKVASILEGIPISLSHHLGGIGLIERENTTILNAALKKVMKRGFNKLIERITPLGFSCPIFISQNNGSVITLDQALMNPILTLSSGATNSFVGGGRLAKVKDAIIVDIGGTSTDVGIIKNGYPRRCLQQSMVGGVSLNFSTPDVLSIAMGGGSHIEGFSIGPTSCGKDLFHRGRSFGGDQLTLTDIALSLGQMVIPQTRKLEINHEYCENILRELVKAIDKLVNKINSQEKDLPVVLVGGGAALIPSQMLSSRYQIPPQFNVANAYGAALGEISTTLDTIICLDERDTVLEKLKEQLLKKTGRGSRLVECQVIPYYYMPGNKARVVMMAVQPLHQEVSDDCSCV